MRLWNIFAVNVAFSRVHIFKWQIEPFPANTPINIIQSYGGPLALMPMNGTWDLFN